MHAFASSNHEYQFEIAKNALVHCGGGGGSYVGRCVCSVRCDAMEMMLGIGMDSNLGAAFNQSMQFEQLSFQFIAKRTLERNYDVEM